MQLNNSFILLVLGLAKAQLNPGFVQTPVPEEAGDSQNLQYGFTYADTTETSFGPTAWGNLTCDDVNSCPGWPTNWELINPHIPYDGEPNNCRHCTDSSVPKCRRARQSPIRLDRGFTEHSECIDRHRMNYRSGTLRFEVMPHVLRVHQPKEPCNEMPNIDFSRGFPDPWHLAFSDISVPAQHLLDGVRYDAEVVLSHVYSVSNRTDRLVGNVSVLLQKGNESDRYDFLDLYIKSFEEEVTNIYRACKHKYMSEAKKNGIGQRRLLRRLPRHKRQHIETEYFNRTFNPYDWYLKTGTEYYWRYEGTTLVPPCLQTVHWRVLKDPIRVAPSQILDLERLLALSRDPLTCKTDTVGRQRTPGVAVVDVNRPLQVLTPGHHAVFCECIDWVSRAEADIEWCKLPPEARGVVVHPTSTPSGLPSAQPSTKSTTKPSNLWSQSPASSP